MAQLLLAPACPDRAREIGRLGFLQWLAGLPGGASWPAEADRALAAARPFIATDPAVAEFSRLIEAARTGPPRPLDIALPPPRRRGGARRRRLSL